MTRKQVSKLDENLEGSGQGASTMSRKYESSIDIRIITHNIRYATEAPFKGEERWRIRCPRLCAELIFNSTSIPETFICLQEVLHSQLVDVLTSLNGSAPGEWDYIGVGRDDGKQAGEYSPIYYRPSIFHVKKWRTVWLSETPEKPSKGWDAASIRIVTVGVFEHAKTGKHVLVMSTHFDEQGVQSRRESAKIILDIVESEAKLEDLSAVLLAGDFNSPPDDGAYQVMTAPNSGMEDIGVSISKERRYGNEMTFTSFGHVDNTQSRIDFIFSRKQDHLKYATYAVLANRFDDGVYLSDHRACVADVQLREV
jgi:endonuclease/exonuclease/phosphatase family metal-dependent hydrolase